MFKSRTSFNRRNVSDNFQTRSKLKIGTIRTLGIFAGILLGTIAAVTFRVSQRIDKANKSPTILGSNSSADSTDEEEDEFSEPPTDPGRRSTLASLVKSAKDQPGWLQDFEFTDQLGRKVTSESLKGKPYIACFFFTTCPSSCPRQTSQLQLLHNKYKNKPIQFVSISVDPNVDTQEKLAEYAAKYQADPERWYFLRAPIDYVSKVGVEKFFLDGVQERGHPDRFCLVNAEGDIVGSYVWLDIDERELLTKHIEELIGK